MTLILNHPQLRIATLALSLLSVTACTTISRLSAPPRELSTVPETLTSSAAAPDELPRASADAIREIEQEILLTSGEIGEPKSTANFVQRPKIPLEINQNVRKWIHYFSVTDRERFHRFLKRGSTYKPLVQDLLRKNGVPTDLYYLAMIESGYVTHAHSHASAVGIWQFIKGTGLRYGLKQDRDVDERRDIVRATEAAAKYLGSLHLAYQSWYLAMASYNAGEGRILGAIMRGQSRDFWELVEKKALPPETRDYVPKFLAATIIGKHPEKYGFHDIDSPKFPEVKALEVPGGVTLKDISDRIKIPFATLYALNPQLLRKMTPRSVRSYSLWVPKDTSVNPKELHAQLASLSIPEKAVPAATQSRYAKKSSRTAKLSAQSSKSSPRKKTVIHRVRPGEGLAQLANRYQVPVKKIKKLNSLRGNRIFAGQKLIIARGV